MKKTLLFGIILVAIAYSLSAQALRSGVVQNEDSCYLYAVDSLPTAFIPVFIGNPLSFIDYYEEPNSHGEKDLTAKYPANRGKTVYGIAVTAPNPLLGNMYLDLSIINSDSMVYRLASASNSDPYILTNYRYEGYTHSGQYFTEICPSYEYYFDSPVHILADSFYAGIRVVTNQAPYDEYKNYGIFALWAVQTFYNITNIVNGSMLSLDISHLGNFFPIVKLPCPAPEPPVLQANVPGLAILHLGDDEGVAYQVVVYNDAGDTVLLSDTTSNPRFVFSAAAAERWYEARVRSVCTYSFSGSDTLAYSRWSEPRRFYYSPDTTAITPFDLQPTTLDLHPNPATGWVSVAVPEACIGATLQLLDLEGRLLQDIKVLTSKFEIDLSSLPPGVYFLRSHGTTQRIVKK